MIALVAVLSALVVALVRQALTKDRTILVLSAFGGVTDLLIQAGIAAAAGDESYKEKLQDIERRHLEAVIRRQLFQQRHVAFPLMTKDIVVANNQMRHA